MRISALKDIIFLFSKKRRPLMEFVLKTLLMISITSLFISNISSQQSNQSTPKTLEGSSIKISSNDIANAIGIINTVRGGLFPAGEAGTTNAFTQFKDPESVARWDNRMKETEQALKELLSGPSVLAKTRTLILSKFGTQKIIHHALLDLLTLVFTTHIQPLLPPSMTKSSDNKTPIGTGKLKELELDKLNFTDSHPSIDDILGNNISKLYEQQITLNNELHTLRKEKTNGSDINKALDLLIQIGELNEASLTTVFKDYLVLLFHATFLNGIYRSAQYPKLANLWIKQIKEVGKISTLLDNKYKTIVNNLINKHENIINTISSALKERTSQAMQNFHSLPSQIKSTVDTITKKLPSSAKKATLSTASQDSLLLIKTLYTLLEDIAKEIK